jgi:hypothetical protein
MIITMITIMIMAMMAITTITALGTVITTIIMARTTIMHATITRMAMPGWSIAAPTRPDRPSRA